MNLDLPTQPNHLISKNLNIVNIIKLILKVIVPSVILISGLVILTLKIPGWRIILGLPMIVIGVVFLIYSYDELVSSKFGDFE